MAKKTSDKRPYHHGDLRRALIDEGLKIVTESGPQGLTIRAVARRVGVTHTAPYRHFADKDEIIAAIAEEGLIGLRAFMLEQMDIAGDDPLMRYQASGIGFVVYAFRHPDQFRVMWGNYVDDPAQHPTLEDAKDMAFGVVRDAIAVCQAEGQLAGRDTEELSTMSLAMVHGLAGLVVDGQIPIASEEDVIELTRRMTNNMFRGLHPK